MRRHRTLTWAGATAAVVAIGFMLAAPATQPVEARTILRSFSESFNNVFQVTLNDIGEEGMHVSGRVLVTIKESEGAEPQRPADMEPDGVYLNLEVQADEDADPDIAGLVAKVEIALKEGQEWIYMKIPAFPEQILEEAPFLGVFQQMAQDGVLISMDGLMAGEMFEGISLGMSEMFGALDQAQGELRAEILTEVEKALAEAEKHEGLSEQEAQEIREARVALGAVEDFDEEALAQIEELARGLFTGELSREDLDQLMSLIESTAGTMTVEELGAGEYLLIASGFDDDDPDIKDAVFKVRYREGFGVPWAEIANIGAYKGSVRIELAEVEVDESLFDKSRYLDDGVTKVLDLSGLMQFVESM